MTGHANCTSTRVSGRNAKRRRRYQIDGGGGDGEHAEMRVRELKLANESTEHGQGGDGGEDADKHDVGQQRRVVKLTRVGEKDKGQRKKE